MTNSNEHKLPIKIGLFADIGLGDGLLWLILANNLQRCGYKASLYSNNIYQLRSWLKIDVKKLEYDKPDNGYTDFIAALDKFDLIIAETSSLIRRIYKEFPETLRQRLVFISMKHRLDAELIFNYSLQNFTAAKQADQAKQLYQMACAASGCAVGALPGVSLVNKMTFFCGNILEVKDATSDPSIFVPPGLSYRRYPKRVTIHPTSANPNKNWPPDRYINLARQLKDIGWDPVICVAPNEWDEWNNKVKEEFALPKFADITALASFMYESGYMIGNDSGPGHLASCLKIPALIVWKRFNDRRWQPGWFFTELVSMPFKIPFVYNTKYWHYFVPVKKVVKQFQVLVKKHAKYFSSRTATC